MFSAVRQVYTAFPQSKWFYVFLVSSPLLLVIVPLGILLSQPVYAAVFDLSISILVLSSYYGTYNSPSSYSGLIIILPAVIRLLAIHYIHGLTSAPTNNQRRALASLALATSLAQIILTILQRAKYYPTYVIAIIGITSLLVFISTIWVPTSYEEAFEAETQMLKEGALIDRVERGKKAGISYIMIEKSDIPQLKKITANADKVFTASNAQQSSSSSVPLVSDAVADGVIKPTTPNTAIVMLHGYGAGAAFWLPHLSEFSALSRVYSLDILGFGMSDHDPFTATTPEEAERHYVLSLNRWRETEGLDSLIIIGHSFGGWLGAAYGLAYPQYVRYLILVSPVGIPNPPSAAEFGSRFPPAARRFRSIFRYLWQVGLTPGSALHFAGPFGPYIVKQVIKLRFGRFDIIQRHPSIMSYLYHINAGKGSGLATLNAIIMPGAYARHPLGNRMKEKLSIPTHFIYGENDWMDSAESRIVAKGMADRNVIATTTIIPHCGHQVSMENPREFEAAVVRVVKEMQERDR